MDGYGVSEIEVYANQMYGTVNQSKTGYEPVTLGATVEFTFTTGHIGIASYCYQMDIYMKHPEENMKHETRSNQTTCASQINVRDH